MTTLRPAIAVLAETAAGTATAGAYLAGAAIGYLHRHPAPLLLLLALAVTTARARAYRPGHR